MIDHHKLKGNFGAKYKSPSYSQVGQNYTTNLEILYEHLKHHLRLYEDFMGMNSLMEDVDEKKIIKE